MARFVPLFLYLMLLGAALGGAAFGTARDLTLARGIEPDLPATPKIIGTNVALEQYTSEAELQNALTTLKRAGITFVRQYFPWREIEAQRGHYDWAKWDRLVDAARQNGIQVVAVLYTAPAWSQRENERDLPGAPAADFAEYARFAADFARRYAGAIDYYQIWDEPNVAPSWGRRNADPVEYAHLLMPAADAIRAADPGAKIVLAGLAMNQEVHRPHPYYSEILFLRGLYEVGAAKAFDIVAAKPYGMWTGPEDRTVSSDVLNFSRLILLRDEMRQYGDKNKPVWAVEMGWNALPDNWEGEASPWGTDSEDKQADRLLRALARVQAEWNWVTGEFPLYLQPNVPPNNARWGLSLLAQDGTPRLLYKALQRYIAAPPAPVSPPPAPVLPILLLAGVAAVSSWRVWHWSCILGIGARWRALKTLVHSLPGWVQVAVLLALATAFYLSPSTPLNFVLLALLGLGLALRLDLGLALTVFVIPFWNYPKTLFGSFELSPVEVLTWTAAAAFAWDAALSGSLARAVSGFGKRGANALQADFARIRAVVAQIPFSPLDGAVLAFGVWGLASTRWAGNFGVASREFRIIVLDPIMLYALVRLSALSLAQVRWLVWALLGSGAAVCLIGLEQFATGTVIQADGVARLTAVWGSPNNVGLYLGRLLPIALAFALFLRPGVQSAPWSRAEGVADRFAHWLSNREPWIALGLVVLFGVAIFLTFSRGALFLGVPTSILFVLVMRLNRARPLSRRSWFILGAVLGIGVLALVPFLNTERFQNLFQTDTGTGFFRLALWTSTVNMIRDHVLLGVGLDNFLYEYPKYILPEAWREPNLSHPHNVVLDFWARLGLIGLALLLWLLVAFYRRAWRTFQTTGTLYTRVLVLGLMGSMVNFLAHGLIDAAYFVVDLAYIFMLTLALAQVENQSLGN